MKISKKITVLLILVVSFIGNAQDKLNQFDDKGERHGTWKGYYDDSKLLRYEGSFIHGKESGLFTYYANSDKKL